MKHKTIIILVGLFFLFVFTASAQQNTGTIKGRVITNDNKPAAGITIILKGTKKITGTNDNGSFILKNIRPGNFQLEITLVGYESLEQPVNVEGGKITTEDLQLKISQKQLQEVVVIAGRRNRFYSDKSYDVAKMPLKDLENPQVYTTVTGTLMKDQLTVDYADALKNIPGVIMELENNTAGGSVTSRGFPTQSFLRNGVVGIAGSGNIDVSNIESIEAIKGPSGALFGSSLVSFGGLFNIVTKKPFETFKSELSYTGGGYGLNRFTADINTPLNADTTLLFRINAAVHHEASWQDAGFTTYQFVAPSLIYKINDKTTLELDGQYQNEQANNFYRLFVDGSNATGVRSPKDLNMNWQRRFIGDGLFLNSKQTDLFATLTQQFSKQWVARTNFTYLCNTLNGGDGYLSMLPGNDSLTRTTTYYNYYNNYATDIQENVTGDFHIGKMRNRLLLGAEFYSLTTKANYASTTFDKLSVINPGVEYAALSNTSLQTALYNTAFSTGSILTNTYSAYVQDVLNITDRFLVLAALRWNDYDYKGQTSPITEIATGGYNQGSFSPKFGAVYQLVKDKLSLFGNYMNGFSNVAPVQQTNGTTSVFKPEYGNQWEGGVKADVLNGKLSGSISYYDIEVSNVVRADAPANPQLDVQNGTQYSKGVEIQATANPLPGFNIIAGYAYNNSIYENINASENGFRPSSAGPANLANAWLSYRIQMGVLKGLGLGFGGNYASENKVINDVTDHYALPSFTTLNAALSYDKRKYNIICKIDNLTNQQYWVGWATTIPEMPIRFSASFTLKF